ncbi:hypothetical protein DFH06DRAFT_1347329 [Mycena polygramma]|nr:hypothetical protein DFH06DRAFT_1347329 [Mycena polygramma]
MSSLDTPSLSQLEEHAVRALHKSVRATRYEDPVDQDAFLVASARTILQFRENIASFAASSEIGESVFAIRSALAQNNSRLSTPPDDIFASISDFAGEIARARQLLRDRKRAQTSRLRAEEGTAARAARREALEYAAKCNKDHDSDVVSIPSDDDEPRASKQPSPLRVKACSPISTSPVQVRLIALSPLPELETLMFSLRLSNPCPTPPDSPSSPARSLPDLVPIESHPYHRCRANAHALTPTIVSAPPFHRGRTQMCTPPNTRMATPAAPVSNAVVLAPRPIKPSARRPIHNFADDLLLSRPQSTGFHARKNIWLGSYKHVKKPQAPNRKPKAPYALFLLRASSFR